MVTGTHRGVAAAWGQALPRECQPAASAGKKGLPESPKTRWDGAGLGQGLPLLLAKHAAALRGVRSTAASAPLSTSSPGRLHRSVHPTST